MFLLISSIILILFYKPWESMSVSMHNLASGMHVIEFGPLIDLVVHMLSEYCAVLIYLTSLSPGHVSDRGNPTGGNVEQLCAAYTARHGRHPYFAYATNIRKVASVGRHECAEWRHSPVLAPSRCSRAVCSHVNHDDEHSP